MNPLANKTLLSQNSELRKAGVYNWTIPAHAVRLSNGELFNACPNAGTCARVCYAKFGTYRFSNVAGRHLANLEYVLYERHAWKTQMLDEVGGKRFMPTGQPHVLDHDPNDAYLADWIRRGGKAVRIHDAGDFFDSGYLTDWLDIAEHRTHVLFYAYTKEVTMLLNAGALPANFRVVFSYGGLQDGLIDRDAHRHADVFPTAQALTDAGYYNQEDNDLLAITAPSNRIGIVANNLPVAIRRFNGKAMSAMNIRNEAPTNTTLNALQ